MTALSSPMHSSASPAAPIAPVIEVRGLRTHFTGETGIIRAVDGVDLHVRAGECLGLVGESGCGKTITALSLVRLVSPPGRIAAGEILYDGRDLVKASEADLLALRGDRISMIFQQPKASLNPVIQIGWQVAELFCHHRGMARRAAWLEAVELLKAVGLPAAERKALAYPHELSGGQAQRVMIAMALALKPRLLIADEPTTALDVTVQAQILHLLRGLCRDFGTALILVTHDLGVVAETADRVAVMYAGQIVETADVVPLFAQPAHPYTRGLLHSMPVQGRRRDRLDAIPGSVPPPGLTMAGCRFAPRCSFAFERCHAEPPPLVGLPDGRQARCWLAIPEPTRSRSHSDDVARPGQPD
ncbi:MAG: putative transporter ATP-binding protein [Proteobacteria bacterium]|nr:putative transporter ATP-binding protein [Pseudomonadota bacterium]